MVDSELDIELVAAMSEFKDVSDGSDTEDTAVDVSASGELVSGDTSDEAVVIEADSEIEPSKLDDDVTLVSDDVPATSL